MSAPVLTPVAVELGSHTGHCYAVCDANHVPVPMDALVQAFAERDAALAEVARMRPVVEAALLIDSEEGLGHPPSDGFVPRSSVDKLWVAAHAYRAKEAPDAR